MFYSSPGFLHFLQPWLLTVHSAKFKIAPFFNRSTRTQQPGKNQVKFVFGSPGPAHSIKHCQQWFYGAILTITDLHSIVNGHCRYKLELCWAKFGLQLARSAKLGL